VSANSSSASARETRCCFAAGTALWYGALILRGDIFPIVTAGHVARNSVDFVGGLGVGLCLVIGIHILLRARRLRANPGLRAAVCDEYAQQVKLRAGTAAFISLVLAQIIMLGATAVWPALDHLPATLTAKVTLLAAVVALGVSMLVYGRE